MTPISSILIKTAKSMQKGFTLIELLASTVVIVTVGAIVITIIISSLRGTNKTNTVSTARQNGTYAISQISKMLRFARNVDAVDGQSASTCITNTPLPSVQPTLPSHTSITFTTINGETNTIACLPLGTTTGAPLTIASMSGTLPNPVTSITGSLLDTIAVHIPSGMCHITCNQSTPSDAIIIGINFFLDAVKPTGTLFSEFAASSTPIEFKTSIILRNTD